MTALGETYHHWRVFCGHSSGVCIEFLKKDLLEHVKTTQGVRSGPVHYMTLGKIERTKPDPAEFPFIKQSEQAFRAHVTKHGRFRLGDIFSIQVSHNLEIVQLVAQKGFGKCRADTNSVCSPSRMPRKSC
jgi:hypothetical protein